VIAILAPPDRADTHERLGAAVEAHLSAYEVRVIRHEIPSLPEQFVDQAEIARVAARETGASAVAWVDEPHATFLLMLAREAYDDRFLQRPIPGGADEWLSGCDGLATMVHSSLLPILTARSAKKEAAPAGSDAQPAQQVDDREPPSSAGEVARDPGLPVALDLLLRAGYGIDAINPDRGVQHGARLGLGMSAADHLELLFGLDLLFPLDAADTTAGADVALRRWPLRLLVGGYLSPAGLDIGLRLGLALDFIEIEGLDEAAEASPSAPDTRKTNPGFACSLFARYPLTGWLSLWIEVSMDLFSTAYLYYTNSPSDPVVRNVVLDYSGAHGGVMAGLSANVDLRRHPSRR